ncbi:MAG: ArdC-like ssDNA-binding domain-containing protein [Candidatus Tectimicrobiota bacterium]
MAQHNLAYTLITDRIVTLLEAGTVPWHRPWDAAVGAPRNLVSKHHYRGVNVFLLGSQHFASPWWLSFPKQVNDLGGRLRAGEKVTYVVFWKPLERTQVHADGTEDTVRIPLLRWYKVVNLLQCTGLPTPASEPPAPRADAALAACAALVANMPQRKPRHDLRVISASLSRPAQPRLPPQSCGPPIMYPFLIHGSSGGVATREHQPTPCSLAFPCAPRYNSPLTSSQLVITACVMPAAGQCPLRGAARAVLCAAAPARAWLRAPAGRLSGCNTRHRPPRPQPCSAI